MRVRVASSIGCAVVLLMSSAVSAQISFGIQIGAPPPPPVYVVPAQPGPEFMWIEGYWYPQGGHYSWHAGYWTRPPYEGAHWVAPHHDHGQYFAGYWNGPRGRFEHDHRWDHEEARRDDARVDRREDRREERREDRHDDRR
jgi:hypothetical protein